MIFSQPRLKSCGVRNAAATLLGDDGGLVGRLLRQIEDLAQNWPQAPVVEALHATRGVVAFNVAVTLFAEIGDFSRFANPRQLMARLGLVPSERSSGRTVHRAGITKAVNALARRALIEGAWTYRMQPRVSRKLHDRIEALPQGAARERPKYWLNRDTGM